MKIARRRRSATLAGLLAMGLALGGCATSRSVGPGGEGNPPPPKQPDPAFQEALHACAQAQGSAEPGPQPDRDKLDACLKAKGFEHPAGPGPDGAQGNGAPPPHDPVFAAAFQACAAEQGVHLPEPGKKPAASAHPAPDALNRDKLDACLKTKGFEHPAGPGPNGSQGTSAPPPPRDPAFAIAFKACAAEQGVHLPDPGEKQAGPARPALDALNHDKLDACLATKGFKRPSQGQRTVPPAEPAAMP